MNQQLVAKELALCLESEENASWYGLRALESLRKGLDPTLVRRSLACIVKADMPVLTACRRLPDEYAPLVVSAVAKGTGFERVLLTSWLREKEPAGPQVRALSEWLFQLTKDRDLQNPRGLEAAQATVAQLGLGARSLIEVLVVDGSESSADVLLPHVHAALKRPGPELEQLRELISPQAHGPHFTRLVELLTATSTAREASAPLVRVLQRLGLESRTLKLKMYVGSTQVRKGRSLVLVSVDLQTRTPPYVEVSACHAALDGYFSAEDGKVDRRSFGLKAPLDADALPAWLSTVARKFKVTWATPRVQTTLRGNERRRVIAWLMGTDS